MSIPAKGRPPVDGRRKRGGSPKGARGAVARALDVAANTLRLSRRSPTLRVGRTAERHRNSPLPAGLRPAVASRANFMGSPSDWRSSCPAFNPWNAAPFASWRSSAPRIRPPAARRPLLPLLEAELRRLGAKVEVFPLGEGRANILATWGEPRILFSTHLDVVPPDLPSARHRARRGRPRRLRREGPDSRPARRRSSSSSRRASATSPGSASRGRRATPSARRRASRSRHPSRPAARSSWASPRPAPSRPARKASCGLA